MTSVINTIIVGTSISGTVIVTTFKLDSTSYTKLVLLLCNITNYQLKKVQH